MASSDEEHKSTSRAPYPKWILAAISALGEKEGSNKSDISKFIETTYSDVLPEGHEAALSDALSKMKESGELLFVKNNYLKPDPSSTPRRGRGRPPKPKQPLPPGVSPPTPRPRGRPPKPKDPLAAAIAKAASGLPRPRGRPPKKHRPAVATSPKKTLKSSILKPSVAGLKRGRGRPPKVRVPETHAADE
ncbi:HMG-Y-related protein B-like [Phalaenopsis equestris]|uniref:HMG-Y-related protein B-like n=1 Tax=Phalaenopsis equestris TaxID=78828 RepID=UPI0009E2F8B4|nr:HMG-Y-related protein B-like [Phalaenopsis equestris]